MNRQIGTFLNTVNGYEIEVDVTTLVAQQISVAAINDEIQLSKRNQEEIIAWARHAQASNGFG